MRGRSEFPEVPGESVTSNGTQTGLKHWDRRRSNRADGSSGHTETLARPAASPTLPTPARRRGEPEAHTFTPLPGGSCLVLVAGPLASGLDLDSLGPPG